MCAETQALQRNIAHLLHPKIPSSHSSPMSIPLLQLVISGNSLEQMPLLNCQFLTGYKEQHLAHLILSFITMGYVWQEGETQPKEVGAEGRLFCHPAGLRHPGCACSTIFPENGSLLGFLPPGGYELKEGQRVH